MRAILTVLGMLFLPLVGAVETTKDEVNGNPETTVDVITAIDLPESEPSQQESCTAVGQFQLKRGTLKDNLERILEQEYQGALLVFEVGVHRVFTDACIKSDSADGLVQQMIEPYTSPERIYMMTFRNNVVAVFYENNPKYAQYLRSAR